MNETLMGSMGDKEIMEAMNEMDPRKAPGIDDLSSFLFKEIETWSRQTLSDIVRKC